MGMSEVLTVKEVAAYLKTSCQQVRRMILAGDLPAVKIGREWRIQMEILKAVLDSF